MTKEQIELIQEHGPYRLRDGVVLDQSGVALALLTDDPPPEGVEWDVAVVATLNAVCSGELTVPGMDSKAKQAVAKAVADLNTAAGQSALRRGAQAVRAVDEALRDQERVDPTKLHERVTR